MAIDTEDKRRSVQAYTFGLTRPVPNNDVSAADRAMVTWLYSGLFDGGAPVAGEYPAPPLFLCNVGRFMNR